MDLSRKMQVNSMRPLQWRVMVICLLVAIVDGYELIIMSFVAPTLAQEWGLQQVSVGYVLSAGLLGMGAGAMFLGPLADRMGRRNHILMCLVIGAVGMMLTGLAQNLPSLILARVFAGLWIGAIVPSFNALVAEYSSDRRRGTAMGLLGLGVPIGGVVGGLATGPLMAMWGGWQGPFVVTGVVALLVAVLAYFFLPESVAFLIHSRPKNAINAYNRIADRLGYNREQHLPEPSTKTELKGPLRTITSGILLTRTILLWSAFSLTICGLYFANLWTPSLIASATGDPATGRTVGVVLAGGAIVGSLVFSGLAGKWNPRVVTAWFALIALPVYMVFSFTYDAAPALLVAALIGAVTSGTMQAIYAISPYMYPAAIRGAALGFMVAFGRGVSVLIPILLGYWFAAGGSLELTFQVFGAVITVVGILIFILHRTYRGRTEDPELIFAKNHDIVEELEVPKDGAVPSLGVHDEPIQQAP